MKTLPSCLCIFGFAAAASAGATLMDQVGADDGSSVDTSNITACQYFEAAYSIYSIATLDNFDNSAGSAASEAHAVVSGWNGYATIDGVSGLQVNFYMDPADAAASLVGYASSDHPLATSASWTGEGDLVEASGSWALNAGINFVAVIPSNEFASNGQTGITLSFLDDLGDGTYWQANPGGGFGMPGNQQSGAGASAYRVLAGGPVDPCDQPLGDCSEDVNGDGVFDVNDVLVIIGTFGDVGDGTFRPAGDIWPMPNGDCLVDVNDLLAEIGVFGGDCLPTGACCSVDSCTDGVKEADCGDTWLGDGSTCADCVAGACCASDGSCTYVIESDCDGVFNAGVACADANCMAAPANNDCSGALVISDGDTAIDNTTATSTGDEDFTLCDNFGVEGVYNDLWFSYDATCDGSVTITMCDTVDFDSRIAVYGACGGAMVACNDDCGGSVNGLSSELTVAAAMGDTIIIRVGNFAEGGGGTGTMNVSCQAVAPGACCVGGTDCLDGMTEADCAAFGGTFMGYGTDCANIACGAAGDTCADAWTAVEGANAFDTTDATDSGYGEPDDTQCDGTFLDWMGSPDTWGVFQVPSSGTLTVSLCDATSYDTSLVLYAGSDCGSLTQIACNGDSTVETGCQSYYSGVYDIPVSAGSVYIRIGGWQAAQGSGTCTITFTGAGATGACCVAGSCVGEITLPDCDALGGLWFNGDACADVTCPATYVAGNCDVDENVDHAGCACFVDGDDSETDCNGGSNLVVPTFTNLVLGQSHCCTSSVFVDGPTGGTYRDLDWWTNATINAGGTFTFTIGADSTCLILVVNLDAGTVDYVADHAAGFMGTHEFTLAAGNWASVGTVSDWNTAWICGSGLETYTMQVD